MKQIKKKQTKKNKKNKKNKKTNPIEGNPEKTRDKNQHDKSL